MVALDMKLGDSKVEMVVCGKRGQIFKEYVEC